MSDPSELLVPNAIAQVEPLNNLVANNWRENAVDSRNSTVKQLAAFALIAGYFYLGGVGVESGSYTTVGAVSLAYATSSLFGYFGMATAPIVKLMRVNMISVVCALMGMMSLMGGMDMALAMLTVMHIFDAYQGAINENGERERTPDISNFERVRGENELEQRNDGPILSFFTESWRINSFSKKNFETC